MQTERRTSLSDRTGRTTVVKAQGGRRLVGVLLIVAAVVLLLDQLSKWLVLRELADGAVVNVIGEVLRFRLVRNPGAAFSFATGYTFIFTIIAAVVVVVILRVSRKLASLPWAIALGLLLGGAVGNLTDRIFREPKAFEGHVIDFISLPNFAVFNLADSAITCGAVLMVILTLMGIEYDGGREESDEPGGEPADDTTDAIDPNARHDEDEEPIDDTPTDDTPTEDTPTEDTPTDRAHTDDSTGQAEGGTRA